MKKIILNSLVVCNILIMVTGCINVGISGNRYFSDKTITGNGITGEKNIGNLDFQGIDARGSINVIVSRLSDAPVKISGDENLLDLIEISVQNDILTIKNKDNVNYSTKTGLKVTVPNNGKIKSIFLSGSSDLTAENPLIGETISVTCKGSSDFKGDINAETCNLDMSGSSDFRGRLEASNANFNFAGSSDCKVTGHSDNCKISMSGSSDFQGYDFIALKADCFAAGSSDIKITCKEEITVNASGSSDVHYKGNAKVISKRLSGSSDLYKQ